MGPRPDRSPVPTADLSSPAASRRSSDRRCPHPLQPPLAPPALSVYTGDDRGPGHATRLELFIDLVFVVALARLGTALHHDLTLAGFGEFALLFFLLWWIWLSHSYAADLFGADDTVSELTFLAAMVVVLLLLVPVGTVVPSVAIVPAIALALLGLIVYEARLELVDRREPAGEAS